MRDSHVTGFDGYRMGMRLNSKLMGIGAAAAAAAASVFAVGYGASAARPEWISGAIAESSRAGSGRAIGPLALSGAVVIAQRPTLNEILDLVLGDRNPDGDVASGARTTANALALERGSEEARIAAILRARTADPMRANRIAAALVREGRRASIGSTLLVGVLLTENPELEPRATSPVGARGLMQVMPIHAGKWGCPSSDLFDIEANICHGVRILADNLQHSRTLPAALLRYNGCSRGTNTPNCYLYASTVYRHARRSVAADGRITAATPFASVSPRAGSKGRRARRGES